MSDTDEFLKSLTLDDLMDAELEIVQNNPMFTLVGSRYILGDAVAEGTDYDFIAMDTFEVRALLDTLGFRPHTEAKLKYFDICTSGIYYFTGLVSMQVVLKKPESWGTVIGFWKLMKENPELFKNTFWKSHPKYQEDNTPPHTAQEGINTRINFMLEHIIPYML